MLKSIRIGTTDNGSPQPAPQALKSRITTQPDTLSQQTGLAYLKDLKYNPKAHWSQVQLAHYNWNYSQSGLTPAGAALLSIAVAAYAPGLSSGLTSSITSVAGASAATALNAGFAALAAQASVAMVNNGGDIGKTLNQLGSEQSVKNLLTTMATAGALQSLDKALGFADSTQTVTGQNINATGSSLTSTTSGVATSQTANAFQQNLLKNVTNNIAGSAIDAAISGKAFDEKTLSTALSNALITAGMAQGANNIGASSLDDFTKKMAHAALGCAGGAAISGTTGGSGCSAGAVGAVVGELAAQYINPSADPALKDKTLAFAKTMSAVAGTIAGGGGDNAVAVNVAATTGANAAENNWLSATDLRRRDQRLAAARKSGNVQEELAVLKEFDFKSAKNTGAINYNSVLTEGALQAEKAQLEQLLAEPNIAADTAAQARRSITEINTAINVIQKSPVLRDAAELGLLAVDVATLGELAAAKALSTVVVRELVASRTGKAISDDAATRILNNFYAEGSSSIPPGLNTSAGVIPANPNKTTTVLGTYVNDTKSIIEDQLKLPKNNDINIAQPGGFNLLNTDNDLYKKLGAEEFWNQVNRPFLDKAIGRGDDIVIATPPSETTMYRNGQLSGFGREIQYLESKGYKFDPRTNSMIKGK